MSDSPANGVEPPAGVPVPPPHPRPGVSHPRAAAGFLLLLVALGVFHRQVVTVLSYGCALVCLLGPFTFAYHHVIGKRLPPGDTRPPTKGPR